MIHVQHIGGDDYPVMLTLRFRDLQADLEKSFYYNLRLLKDQDRLILVATLNHRGQ